MDAVERSAGEMCERARSAFEKTAFKISEKRPDTVVGRVRSVAVYSILVFGRE